MADDVAGASRQLGTIGPISSATAMGAHDRVASHLAIRHAAGVVRKLVLASIT